MGVSILELPTGNCSLEIQTNDVPDVRQAIKERWGEMVMGPYLSSQSVKFGGTEFVFQNEWDDPCLVSTSPAGISILHELAELLSARQKS